MTRQTPQQRAGRVRRAMGATWLTLLLSWSGVVQAAAPACARLAPVSWNTAALRHCEAQGIPAVLARAVIQVESGGHPYALRLNVGRGRGVYPRTHGEAVRLLQVVLPRSRNVDIGLMQVNLGIWGARLRVTAAQLLEPATNLRVGCHILRRALATRGPAWQRLGRYHTGTPARQRAYALRVTAWLERLLPLRPDRR
jgi:soluble lytic murein transglycosylase-like protein